MGRRTVVVGPDTKMVRTGGRPSRTVIILLSVHVGLFILYAFADGPKWVQQHLMLSAGQALGLFELWQPLTASWLHLHTHTLLINMLALWFFGPPLERWWGTRRFVVFWIVTGLVGMVATMLVGMGWPTAVTGGATGAAAALMVAFALLFPEHMVYCYGVWPLKARWLGLLLLLFVLVGAAVGGEWLQLPLQLGGGLGALLFIYNPRRMVGEARVRRAKRKFKVIEGGKKDDGPTYLN